MTSEQHDKFLSSIIQLFKPRPRQSVVEWSEHNLSLDTTSSALSGPYSTAMTPYVREILNTFSDGNIERIVCCFGAQTAKTQTFMCGLAWTLANEPSPTMWVMPNKDLAESFSDTRLRPMLQTSEEIASMILPKKRLKKTEIQLEGALLTLVGSNSPANLASRPVRVLVLDEIDKFPMRTAREADALSLAIERTMSFPEPKIFLSSTPTTSEGQIWQEYLNGDQRRYFLPCPFCQKELILTLNPSKSAFDKMQGCESQLTWSSKAKRSDGTWDYELVERTAHFLCPHCGQKIFNHHKQKMLAKGVWRPTNPYADKKVRSYHLPTFYAPWRKASWGELAVEFLKSKSGVGGLRNFINSKCAEPDAGQWEGEGGNRREHITLTLCDANTPKTKIRFMTVDRQKDYFYYLIREWYQGGDSLLLSWGKADTFDDLKSIADENKVKVVGVDNGFEAVDTNKNCSRLDSPQQPWFALRGDGRQSWPHYDNQRKRIEKPFTKKRIDPLIGTSKQHTRFIWELTWSNPTVKDLLSRLRVSTTAPVKWSILQQFATDEYFQHLNSEYRKREFNRKTGRSQLVWTLRSSRWPNHLLDCECMNIALALFFEILKT